MKFFNKRDIFASIKWVFKNEVTIFEKEFTQYTGIRHVIATGFGRTALYLGLRAIDIHNKEVIVPNFLCTVVRAAVVVAGGIPIFVDVDIENFNYNTKELKLKISERTKAIVLIHYFGRVARNIDDIVNIANQNNLVIIEDCAHSLGAEYKNKKIGSFGDFSIFSLTKGMINCGGGFFATNNKRLYDQAKIILEKCRPSLIKRIADFPLVLEIGIQQYIDKVLSINPKTIIYRTLMVKFLKCFFIIRLFTLKIIKIPFSFIQILKRKRKKKHTENNHGIIVDNRNIDPNKYIQTQAVYMEPIIASLGRMQLRKLNNFIQQKEEICRALTDLKSYHFRNSENLLIKDVHTHLVLRLRGVDLLKVIDKSKDNGIILNTTWPYNQDIWDEQFSANLIKIKSEFVIWEVNPTLSEKEVYDFMKRVDNLLDIPS